jgi:hypothetical protein
MLGTTELVLIAGVLIFFLGRNQAKKWITDAKELVHDLKTDHTPAGKPAA